MRKILISEILIKASPKEIINALVDESELKKWWGINKTFIQPKDGGVYALTWIQSEHGIKFIQTAKINLYNKRSLLYLEDVLYINSEKGVIGVFAIKFDVEVTDGISKLKVTQTGFDKTDLHKWYYEMMLGSWPQALMFLKNHLENKT